MNKVELKLWSLATMCICVFSAGLLLGYFLPKQQSMPATNVNPHTKSNTDSDMAGMPPAMQEMVKKALKNPEKTDPELLLQMAFVYLERQDMSKAMMMFRAAIKQQPENPQALSGLGLLMFEGGHPDQALTLINKAIAVQANHPLALWTKGQVLHSKEDYQGAIEAWSTLLKGIPSDAPQAREIQKLIDQAKSKANSAS